MNGNGVNAYKRTNVTTADPAKLVLMCYEGAIGNLKAAKEECISRGHEAKGKAIIKVQEILNLLMQSLDFKNGGEIATSLDALYSYMLRRLLPCSTIEKEVAAIDEVIHLLEELESAWKEIFAVLKHNQTGDTRQVANMEEEKTATAMAAVTY